MFDRAAEHGSPRVEFFGEQLTLPPEGRFASVTSVQRYVDDVLALPAVRATMAGGVAAASAGAAEPPARRTTKTVTARRYRGSRP